MSDAIRALLGRLIDDAGQFPPAELGLDDAIAAHLAARSGPLSWMIGRFLCPASRLDEGADQLPLPLGVISNRDWAQDLDDAVSTGADIFELRDPGPAAYATLAAAPVHVFVEGAPSLAQLKAAGLGAKLRCGGLAPEAFPADDAVAAFIGECRSLSLPFKLTAGLHHPFRARHEQIGVLQHGFVNMLGATILDLSNADRVAVIAEQDPGAFAISGSGLGWRDFHADHAAIERGRGLFTAFGSCSFDEPVDDLITHGVLEASRV